VDDIPSYTFVEVMAHWSLAGWHPSWI